LPDQVAGLVFRYRADDPLNGVTAGAVQQVFVVSADGGRGANTFNAGNVTSRAAIAAVGETYGGSSGTPAAIAPGAPLDGRPSNHAEVVVTARVGGSSALATGEQLRLIDRASAKRDVCG